MSQRRAKDPALMAVRWDVITEGLWPDNPHFGGTDVDGLIERHGYCLLVEWKMPGEKCPDGQERALEALTRQLHPKSKRPANELWWVIGDGRVVPNVTPEPWCREIACIVDDKVASDFVTCDLAGLRAMLDDWYRAPCPDPDRVSRVLLGAETGSAAA